MEPIPSAREIPEDLYRYFTSETCEMIFAAATPTELYGQAADVFGQYFDRLGFESDAGVEAFTHFVQALEGQASEILRVVESLETLKNFEIPAQLIADLTQPISDSILYESSCSGLTPDAAKFFGDYLLAGYQQRTGIFPTDSLTRIVTGGEGDGDSVAGALGLTYEGLEEIYTAFRQSLHGEALSAGLEPMPGTSDQVTYPDQPAHGFDSTPSWDEAPHGLAEGPGLAADPGYDPGEPEDRPSAAPHPAPPGSLTAIRNPILFDSYGADMGHFTTRELERLNSVSKFEDIVHHTSSIVEYLARSYYWECAAAAWGGNPPVSHEAVLKGNMQTLEPLGLTEEQDSQVFKWFKSCFRARVRQDLKESSDLLMTLDSAAHRADWCRSLLTTPELASIREILADSDVYRPLREIINNPDPKRKISRAVAQRCRELRASAPKLHVLKTLVAAGLTGQQRAALAEELGKRKVA
ncbi:hypothetical protein AB0N09_43605 [Streptomyces erythrochromogenes]|uniref:hypothetical protein n=1 Tax=Streptomyces erythrochromogenes TaxID=285574 RepID=UPI003412869E